ncbi:hypothetical protein LTR16_004077, partial [Cryomyces antarcticus]
MQDEGAELERKRSYGRGGAGNLCRPSEIRAAEEQATNETQAATGAAEDGAEKRRKSSVGSLLSSDTGSRRGSILNLFRRGSKDETKNETS